MTIADELKNLPDNKLPWYVSAVPCRHGHNNPKRYKTSGRCVRCQAIAMKSSARVKRGLPALEKSIGTPRVPVALYVYTQEQADLVRAYAALISTPAMESFK